MRDFRDDLKASGYSLEEAYFYKLNRKLIKKLRDRFGKGKSASPESVAEEEVKDASEEGDYIEKKAA